MRYRDLLFSAFVFIAATACSVAHAQLVSSPSEPGAFYLGIKGGWTNLVSQTDSFPALMGIAGAPAKIRMNYDDGDFNNPQHLVVAGRFGYQWGPWSLEEQIAYRHDTMFHFFGVGAGNSGHLFQGARDSQAFLTNLLYEFAVPDITLADFTFHSPVTFHVGAGIGTVNVLDGVSFQPHQATPYSATLGSSGGTLLHASTWAFGYDGVAGVRYEINPNLFVDLDYAYLATTPLTFHNKASASGGAGSFSGLTYKSSYENHDCVVSLVVKFGAPSPPPPLGAPVPAAPARNVYLVFFDWDAYTITPTGMQVVARAADQYKAGGRVRLEVAGYADLSGSTGYNQRLSERRANAVADALTRLGVPSSDMAVSGHGIDNPRIPTALGVREPQNRRVEIVFT